jgi:site-specific DNA recombinase
MAKPSGGQGSTSQPTLACAIYTRKSSEEGLEQDFNSLHAQREACEAFVLSQKSLGWNLIQTAYDDGGFSGGNVERPALRQLIQDIEAGKVNVIVVYKVDRLTRSLADFAKLVDLFDSKGVSFVSVTQQFNTTTSMGRLTLNVLLSFAQFEREVTGERIRDKIAASKRKGLWMGGIVPVGYRAKGRTLEPDVEQAPRIQEIYELYLKLSSVTELGEELQKRGWQTPERAHKRPGFGGNKPFSRGHLHRILSNPVYIGQMVHKGEIHQGQHPAIIDMALWDAVQARLEAQRNGHKTQSQAAHPSLLSGKIFDETGRRLIPSHARKGNKRYRYYVTPADSVGSPVRLPANEIEQLVRKAVMDWANEAKRVVDAVGWSDAKLAEEAIAAGKKLALSLGRANTIKQSEIELARCIESVQVGPHAVRISVDLVGCGMVKAGADPKGVQLEVAAERKRCGMAVRLVVGGGNNGRVSEPDQTLIQLVNKAREWLDRLTRMGQGISEIAKAEDVSPGYVTRLLHLALLAPDITQSIAVGDHPADVNATRLMQALPLPLDWGEQRELLGMT